MAINVQDEDDEVEGDMTPMIDIIFLLLVFFILTTKFIPEEKVIANLLPTDKGTANSSAPLDEKEQVNIKIMPGIFQQRLEKPSLYDTKWHDTHHTTTALYQVGNNDSTLINGADFGQKGGDSLEVALKQVHGYLHSHLAQFEGGGPRKDLPPVIIHGFSGMPWKYILAAYDAVRAWENSKGGGGDDMDALLNAREVTFAPPRVRGYRQWEMGYELFEIHHMQ